MRDTSSDVRGLSSTLLLPVTEVGGQHKGQRLQAFPTGTPWSSWSCPDARAKASCSKVLGDMQGQGQGHCAMVIRGCWQGRLQMPTCSVSSEGNLDPMWGFSSAWSLVTAQPAAPGTLTCWH